ncbi:uncharacterized protein LOC144147398 isoform X1 [Haemaphysalis longicornis]
MSTRSTCTTESLIVLASFYVACNTGSIIMGYGSMVSYTATLDHTERPAVHAMYGLVVANRLMNIVACLVWLLCLSMGYTSGLRWIFIYFLVHFNTTILSMIAHLFKDVILAPRSHYYTEDEVDTASYSAEVVPTYIWIILEIVILYSIYTYYSKLQELEAEASKKVQQPVFASSIQ